MTTKHTPGPWHVVGITSWAMGGPTRQGKIYVVNNAQTPSEKSVQAFTFTAANARLIAAAPELLEALQEAQAALDVLAGDIEDAFPTRAEATAGLAMRARAIIAKATGAQP